MIRRDLFDKTRTNEAVWHQERQQRLTASMLGSVVRARNEGVERRILDRHQNNTPNRWIPYPCYFGKQHEPEARKHYENYLNQCGYNATVFPCGLMVAKGHNNIAATPDGLVRTNSAEMPLICLEIKCVFDDSPPPGKSLEELAKTRPNFYLKLNDQGQLSVKPNHAYFIQIQTQLGVTGLPLAHLAVYHPRRKEMKIFEVPFDQATWQLIVNKSDSFYQRHMSQPDRIEAPLDNDVYVSVQQLVSADEPMEVD